jgi:hypothetical protein
MAAVLTNMFPLPEVQSPVKLMIPDSATEYGFVTDGLGSHSSRTIMLSELKLLLAACPRDADMTYYRRAIVEDNVLLKRTQSTRNESFRRLRELYGLDSGLFVFRAMRELWGENAGESPLIALLCALARDPILRITAEAVLGIPVESPATPQMVSDAIASEFPGRLNQTTLANIGRHAASSWTQSGHLSGRSNKVRITASSSPASTAYALFLAYLCGERGEGLFSSPWAQILDAPPHVLHEQAFAASQRGWLEYRHTGMVTEVTFWHFLRGEE